MCVLGTSGGQICFKAPSLSLSHSSSLSLGSSLDMSGILLEDDFLKFAFALSKADSLTVSCSLSKSDTAVARILSKRSSPLEAGMLEFSMLKKKAGGWQAVFQTNVFSGTRAMREKEIEWIMVEVRTNRSKNIIYQPRRCKWGSLPVKYIYFSVI